MSTEAHQPAFPQPLIDNQGRIDKSCDYGFGGLTKREYYAGKMLQAIVTNDALIQTCITFACKDKITPEQKMAQRAIKMADALIVELEKEVNREN